MKIDYIEKNPKEALIYMERYVNSGSPSGFTWINQTSFDTSPLSESKYFKLKMLFNDSIKIKRLGEYPRLSLDDNYYDNTLFIHPDMEKLKKYEMYKIYESDIKVIPTSSARTVKLMDYQGYLKLNYNGIIGRIDRSLTSNHANCSVILTEILKNEFIKNEAFEKLSLFPESGAKILIDEQNNVDCGVVYREEKPFGKRANEIKIIIPAFSMISKDKKNDDVELLTQIINYGKFEPMKYLLDNIIYPIIDNYFQLILTQGFQAEWHTQNLLFGLNNNFELVSLIMRDLESIDIDEEIRNKLGFTDSLNFYPYKYINVYQYNYQIKHSFMFDFKIGDYIFSPFVNHICEKFDVDARSIEEIIKNYIKKYLSKLPQNFFPDSWYVFDKVLIDRSEKERPYINMGIPKYREL
jgi:hypothetical protein